MIISGTLVRPFKCAAFQNVPAAPTQIHKHMLYFVPIGLAHQIHSIYESWLRLACKDECSYTEGRISNTSVRILRVPSVWHFSAIGLAALGLTKTYHILFTVSATSSVAVAEYSSLLTDVWGPHVQ